MEIGTNEIKNNIGRRLSTGLASRVYLCVVLSFIISYFAWSIFWENEQSVLVTGANLICFVGFSIPLVCYIYVLRRTNGKDRTFWLFILLGQVAYLLGEISWDYYELYLKVETPYPGWPDFYYLLWPGFFIIALIYRISMFENKYVSFRFALDIILVMVMVSTFSIQYFIYPIFFKTEASNFYIFVSVAYPISDLGLLFGVLYLWSRSDKQGMHIFYPMIGGITLYLITDAYYLYLNSKGIYGSGALIDLLWVLSLMLVGLSAIFQVEHKKSGSNVQNHKEKEIFEEKNILLYAPYLLIVMLVIMFASNYQLNVVTIGSVVGIMIIVVRQNVTLLDNKKLLIKLKQANEELIKVNFITEINAKTDYLTGLYNRRCIEDVIEKFLNLAQKDCLDFSILMIDIDYFKRVNDEFGHDTGDFILKEIAQILKSNLRSKEIIGRYGGEEFIALLPDVNAKGAKLVAERLRKEVARCDFLMDKAKINVTISIGMSQFRVNEDQEKNIIIKRADKALYEAKKKGRNRTVIA